MVNKPKAAGTAEETKLVRAAKAVGLAARRAAANAPSRDVEIEGDVLTVVEVKHRASLNVHKVLAQTLKLYPEFRCAVLWHRLSRKGDNVKRTPDGPAIIVFTREDALALLHVADKANLLVQAWDAGNVELPPRVTALRAALLAADPTQRVPF
jgi:hypothetical protein